MNLIELKKNKMSRKKSNRTNDRDGIAYGNRPTRNHTIPALDSAWHNTNMADAFRALNTTMANQPDSSNIWRDYCNTYWPCPWFRFAPFAAVCRACRSVLIAANCWRNVYKHFILTAVKWYFDFSSFANAAFSTPQIISPWDFHPTGCLHLYPGNLRCIQFERPQANLCDSISW